MQTLLNFVITSSSALLNAHLRIQRPYNSHWSNSAHYLLCLCVRSSFFYQLIWDSVYGLVIVPRFINIFKLYVRYMKSFVFAIFSGLLFSVVSEIASKFCLWCPTYSKWNTHVGNLANLIFENAHKEPLLQRPVIGILFSWYHFFWRNFTKVNTIIFKSKFVWLFFFFSFRIITVI